MPRQKIFNKKTSTTYALVHRPQNDPLIHDSEASSHVFAQVSGPTEPSTSKKPKKSKVKQRGDLEDEFGIAFRSNEGEAAEQGVFYDDTSYDYMQHMREIGQGAGAATWIEAPTRQGDKKRKDKQQSLEDALRGASLEDDGDDDLESVGGVSFFSRTTGRNVARPKYEDQQDVPDAIAGFQPDMDPRLREVLEALDDEAYVEEEEDFFADLAREGGEEVDQDEFEAQLYNDFDDDDGGWESDTTEKPTHEYPSDASPAPPLPSIPTPPQSEQQQPSNTTSTTASTTLPASDAHIPDSTTDGDWLATFAKSKATTTAPLTFARPNPTPSIAPSAAGTTYTSGTSASTRHKKRKGALTSASGYSMTSSALARTEALSVLDERFERIADSYMNDIPEGEEDEFDDSVSQMTGMTGMTGLSRASRVTAKTNNTWKSNVTGRSKAGGSAWGGSQVSRASGASKASRASGVSGLSDASSVAPQLATADFDNMMDEFLGGVGGHGRGRRMKKGSGNEGYWGKQTGMEQLKEIRGDLGPARLTARTLREAGIAKR